MAGEPAAKRMKAIIKDPQHNRRVVQSLQLFNTRCSFTDVSFICARGHTVNAHKLLLCSVSTQMKELFLEVPDNTERITIHLPDIEYRILTLLLDFLYEGSVRVNKNEYADFQELMNLLGIVLATPSNDEGTQPAAPPPPPPPQPAPPQQPVQQAPQLVYLPAPSHNQGQMQYMLATPTSIPQGQVMQGSLMSPLVQGAIAPQVSTQPVMMSQANGQMVQAAGSQVVTTQIQQNNMMQMVPQNTTQVVPIQNAQMVAGVVSGTQILQSSSQIVLQNNQQAMMNNSQMQVGMQNQVAQSFSPNQPVQQRPQYVMSSTTSQLTTSRGRGQYNQAQVTPQSQRAIVRTRQQPQQQQQQNTNRTANVRTRRLTRAPVPVTQNRSIVGTNRLIQRSRHSTQ